MSPDGILAYSGAVLSFLLAAGVAFQAKRSVARWAFSFGLLALAADRVFGALSLSSGSVDGLVRWQLWRFIALCLVPGAWLLFSLTYARGNAREFLRKWRWGLTVAFGAPIIILLTALRAEPGAFLFLSEEGGRYLLGFGPWGTAFQVVLLLAAILVLVNLERTFRASVGTVRWRIKFMLFGVGVLFTVHLYTTSQALLFQGTDHLLHALNSAALLVACILIAVALLRAGKSDLDVFPSHTVLQGSFTVLLAGVYLVAVGVLAKIAAYLGGDSALVAKALVVLVFLVVLALLLQSDRVRLHLRRFVSRHFQRPLYDYQTVWRKFTDGTASRVEQTDYCRAVVKLLAEIFETLSVTLWLVDHRREELGLAASTSLSESQAARLKPGVAETAAIIRHLRSHPDPIDIETLRDDWAAALRRCHPDEFHKGGTRLCVPVVSSGEVLAVIMLGDRVGGGAFTLQDSDLLKSIADHVAAGLLNVRLSQRLLQAREHEAFQTMAAFFVHDLKNAAATLNLMLQNLPDHFDDPAFREDALRGATKSVAHINNLISRLGQLRSELKIRPVPTDLNAVVGRVLDGFESTSGFVLERDLAPALPALPLDAEQFAKVVTNLVLNAREAMNGAGRLRVGTAAAGGWQVLTAADTGCGMSPEFLSQSLFRPFQTTKKTGLGIGMFQSKMIVEAHGGRIAVESMPGQGTTFRVYLPATPLPR